MIQEDLKVLVDAAVDYGRKKADTVIARCTNHSGSQIRFSQSSVDVASRWEELNMDLLIVLEGQKVGITSVPVVTTDDVRRVVDDTIVFTKRLPASQFFQGVEDKVTKYTTLKERVDPHFEEFTTQSSEVVTSVIDAALSEGAKRVAGALRFSYDTTFMRSSNGPEGSMSATTYDLNVRAFQDELDYSGQGLSCGTQPTRDNKAMIEAGAEAGRLSKQAIGATQGEPGTYDIVFSPTVAANIIGYIPGAANPFLVLIGLSPLGDRIGQQLAPEFVTASDDPQFPGGLASRQFDFEGTPAQKVTIIDRGVLKSFIHNTTTAKMFSAVSTGHSDTIGIGEGAKMLLPNNTNIVFEAGDRTLDELLEGNRPTIYVTSNWYTRWQNYQTGDFSTIPRDAILLFKGGKTTPIKNIRISDNMLRIFANITAMTKERKQIYWWEVDIPTVIPTIRVADCRVTAATQ